MARPKKTDCIEARQRIIDGFWILLENHRLRDITIGMVVEQAQCNRGTFYYHYADMNDLIYAAIEHELIIERSIPGIIFDAACERETSPSQTIDESQQLYRLSLIMEQGGMDLVLTKAYDMVNKLWISVLAPDKGELPENVRIVVEYYTTGMLGTILYRFSEQRNGIQSLTCPEMDKFINASTKFVISQIAQAQDTTEEEILARLRTASCLARQLHTPAAGQKNSRNSSMSSNVA